MQLFSISTAADIIAQAFYPFSQYSENKIQKNQHQEHIHVSWWIYKPSDNWTPWVPSISADKVEEIRVWIIW